MRDALGEDRLGRPGAVRPPLREIDHRLLGTAQVEGCPPAVHRLADRLDVGVGVGVEKLKEKAEIFRIALVRGCRQQEHVVRDIAKQFSELVAQALVGLVRSRHPVRLIHDDQIPMDLTQPGEDLLALGQVEGGDDSVLLDPLVHAELVADVLTFEHEELRVELLLELALPLEGEVGRADDQDALGEAAQLELADEQARHDGLAGAGVVGQQEPHARELEQVVVDRLELMRKRIDARDREPEVGIELVGDAQGVGLQAEAQQAPVAIVGVPCVEDREPREIVGGERHLAEALRLRTDQPDRPARRAVGLHGLHPHGLVE